MDPENPSIYVDKDYKMDPKYEIFLPNGRMLKEGMVVLIGRPSLREDPSRRRGNSRAWLSLEANNRWCKVTELSFIPRQPYHTAGKVIFTGVYGDGGVMQRTHYDDYPWIAKKIRLS